MGRVVQVELEFFKCSERKPSGVQMLLVQVGGLLYPAAYSSVRGFVWADGTVIEESVVIQAWAILPSLVDCEMTEVCKMVPVSVVKQIYELLSEAFEAEVPYHDDPLEMAQCAISRQKEAIARVMELMDEYCVLDWQESINGKV